MTKRQQRIIRDMAIAYLKIVTENKKLFNKVGSHQLGLQIVQMRVSDRKARKEFEDKFNTSKLADYGLSSCYQYNVNLDYLKEVMRWIIGKPIYKGEYFRNTFEGGNPITKHIGTSYSESKHELEQRVQDMQVKQDNVFVEITEL